MMDLLHFYHDYDCFENQIHACENETYLKGLLQLLRFPIAGNM